MNKDEACILIKSIDKEIYTNEIEYKKRQEELKRKKTDICNSFIGHKTIFHTGPGDFCMFCGEEL